MSNLINQNLDTNLSEAQIYYLGLFEKWSKPDNELKGKLYFKKCIEYIKSWNEEIELDEKSLFWLGKLFVIIKQTKEKIKLINLKFPNKLIIEINGDFYDIAPKLVELYKANQLEIINCTLPLELENLVLRNELVVIKNNNRQLETVGKLIWNKEIIITNDQKPLQTLLMRHLAFFGEFIELTEGKRVQLRITSQPNLIILEIFSFNGATENLIEQKYCEFINDTLREDEDQSDIIFNKSINLTQQMINKYEIRSYKRMFDLEKNHTQDLKSNGAIMSDIVKILANKLPDHNQLNFNFHNNNSQNMSNINNTDSLNNNSGQIQNGDNNTQAVTQNITNQAEFIDKLLDLSDVLFEARKQELTPKQSHYVEELEQDINKLKKQPKVKDSKDFLDKVTKLTTLGGGLFALSEKILPILDQLKSFLPL